MGSLTEGNAVEQQRLHQQRLTGAPLERPEQVVSWLAAVQAQDYAGAKWALGLRMREATDALIDKAFDAGAILRTHVMRPTWHFVSPEDIRWLQTLTAPRVNAANASMYRQFELDDLVFSRSAEIIMNALEGGRQLTRVELGVALDEGGIAATGNRLGYIIHRAELDAFVCSGPRRGKQFTYMLVEERAPQARALTPDDALAELTRRYFTGHGPATVYDFSWWSGLSVADARKGVDILGSSLVSEETGGARYWSTPGESSNAAPSESTFLLPTHDEFFMGFTGDSRASSQDVRDLIFDSMIVVDGRIAGTWRRTFQKGAVIVEVHTLPPLSPGDERLGAAVRRYGAFLGLPVELKAVDPATVTSTGWMQSRIRNREKALSGE